MELRNINAFIDDDMHDVGVVPDTFRGQRPASHLHAVDRVVAQPIQANERSLVVERHSDSFDQAVRIVVVGAAAMIAYGLAIQRVDVDADRGAQAANNLIVDDHGLRAADEDGAGTVEASAGTIKSRLATDTRVVVFKRTVRDAGGGLVKFDRIESRKRTLDINDTATVGDKNSI